MSGCCVAFLSPTWKALSVFDCPPWRAGWTDTGRNGQELQQQLWQDLFSKPSEWWDNRLSKRSSRHPDFRNKRSREPLWLNSPSKPQWVDFQLATLNALLGGLQKSSSQQPRGPCDEVESLCEQGQLDMAVDALFQMDKEGDSSVEIYRSVLKACAKRKALIQAKRVHGKLATNGLELNRYISESLVSTFVVCGDLEGALQIFHSLPHKTVVTWTAVFSGHTQAGESRVALAMYQSMVEHGVRPNRYTFISLFKACGSLALNETPFFLNGQAIRAKSLQQGKAIHAEAERAGCESDVFVGSTLISMYAKCGSVIDAQHVFDILPDRNTVSWNAMLTGYAQQGQGDKVLQLFFQMQQDGMSVNDRTIISALQACGTIAEKEVVVLEADLSLRLEALQKGKTIHAAARFKGYECDNFVGSTLISMYAKCGSSRDAKHLFDRLAQKSMVTWNALLSGYAQQGQGDNAMQLYQQMQETGLCPDERTFVSALQACCMISEKEGILDGQSIRVECLQVGKAIHAEAQRLGYEYDVFVGNAQVSSYASSGSIMDAQVVFDGLSEQNVVSWNALLAGYAQRGQGLRALQVYDQMEEEEVSPDTTTFVSVLQACGSLAEKEGSSLIDGQTLRADSLQKGKVLHAEASRRGFDIDVFVGSALISMYGKCGSLLDAQNVLDRLPRQHVVSRNAMLTACIQQGESGKALQLYRWMLEDDMIPDETTLLCILQACGDKGALDTCVQIHQCFVSTLNAWSPLFGNTLIHAYGKCASMENAQEVFDALHQRNVVSWNALIAGYARQGNLETSLQCYEQMQLAGLKPNGVTFLSLISACSHAGQVNKGIEYFESMIRDCGIAPGIEHYVSMLDLFSRAGYFAMIEGLLSNMPLQPDLSMSLCLLAACRKHGNVVLAKYAFDSAMRQQPNCAAAYMLMYSIYAHAGMWDFAKEIEKSRQKAGAWKKAGQSWIEHKQEVYTFFVGERMYKQQEHFHLLRILSVELEDEQHLPSDGSSGAQYSTTTSEPSKSVLRWRLPLRARDFATVY